MRAFVQSGRRGGTAEVGAVRGGHGVDDGEVGSGLAGRLRGGPYALEAAVEVDEGAVLLQPGGGLDVVLAPQGVQAKPAVGADGAAQDGEVGEGTDAVGAVEVLGDAEAVDDRGAPGTPVQPCGGDDVGGGHAGDRGSRLRRIL